MVSRRRTLTALVGLGAIAGCLDTSAEETARPSETASPAPVGADGDRPDWADEDGAVDLEALSDAHETAKREQGIRIKDVRERVDSDEPLGSRVKEGRLELEMQNPDDRLWAFGGDIDGNGTFGYRIEFADMFNSTDDERVEYWDRTLLNSTLERSRELLAWELGSMQATSDSELEYVEPTVYEGQQAHRIESGFVEAVVGADGGIRRIEGATNPPGEDAVVEYERTAEFGITVREPPDWTSQAPWLTLEEVEADLFVISHRGGATVDAGTDVQLRSHLDSGEPREWERSLESRFEPGETRYVVFRRPDGTLEPELRDEKPDEFAELNRPPHIEVETTAYDVKINGDVDR